LAKTPFCLTAGRIKSVFFEKRVDGNEKAPVNTTEYKRVTKAWKTPCDEGCIGKIEGERGIDVLLDPDHRLVASTPRS
jgi:nitrate reductase beta subunit